MSPFQIIFVILFIAFFAGSSVRVVAMVEQKRAGLPMMRSRIVFFFTACLMLICLIPLGLYGMLSTLVTVSDLAAVLVNLVGFALTFDFRREAGEGGVDEGGTQVRAYQVYYQGTPYGIVTKEGFDTLLQYGLLKRQRTVELIVDFKQKAREQGVALSLLRNREGKQTLIRVEPPHIGS